MWCSLPTQHAGLGDHPQEELAKFGYKSERKVWKIEESCCILVTCWNLLSKYGNFREKIPLWCIFPPKVLGMSHTGFLATRKKKMLVWSRNMDLGSLLPQINKYRRIQCLRWTSSYSGTTVKSPQEFWVASKHPFPKLKP